MHEAPSDPGETLAPQDLQIRQARREDMPAIVRLLADDDLGKHRESVKDPLDQAYYDAFNRIGADPRNELIVVERDGEVIGTLQLTYLVFLSHRGSMRAQIESVRVDRRYRGRRVGTHLIQWAIERARQAGCSLVQLTTDADRVGARRFYERLGFTPSHVGMKLHLPDSREPKEPC